MTSKVRKRTSRDTKNENKSPVNGQVFCETPRSTAEDIELALDAAHQAKDAWGKTSVTSRSNILLSW
jgi:aldehyde dehydrogenase